MLYHGKSHKTYPAGNIQVVPCRKSPQIPSKSLNPKIMLLPLQMTWTKIIPGPKESDEDIPGLLRETSLVRKRGALSPRSTEPAGEFPFAMGIKLIQGSLGL